AELLLPDPAETFLGRHPVPVAEAPAAEADDVGEPFPEDRSLARVARPAVEDRNDDDGKLESLRLVDAEDADGVETLVGERRPALLLPLAGPPAALGRRRAQGRALA